MQQYETIFIATPVLTEAQSKETHERYSSFLKDNGCEIINQESWGLKKLAYPIQKKNNGYYSLIEFKGNGDIISKLEVNYKRDVNIMRFQSVKLDRHAVEYNIRRKKKLNETKEAK